MNTKDDTVKEFDANIIKKLLRFTKKYRIWFLFAIMALVLSTVAELSLPVVLQRSIDRYIMAQWMWVESDTLSSIHDLNPELRVFTSDDKRSFLLKSDFEGKHEALSRDDITASSEDWYVFSNRLLPDTQSVDDGFLILDQGMTAIRHSHLKAMDKDVYRSIRQDDISALKTQSILYFSLLFIILIFSFVQIFTMSWTSQGVMKDIRTTMLSHVIGQSSSYLGDTAVGSLVSRITSDVETVNEFFTSVTISMLKDAAIMIGVLITLYFLNPLLAGITIITIPPVIIATALFRKMARSAFRRQRHWISKVNGFLSEHVSGMEIIQIFAREQKSKERFAHDNTELLKASMAEMYVFAIFRPLIDLFTSFSMGVVLYFGASMLNRNILSLGIMIAFIDLIQKFYRPVMDMSEKFSIMQSAMAGGERIFKLLETDHSISDNSDYKAEQIKGEIEFKDVCFSYRKGEPVLRNLSFKARAGDTIAVVGYTGAGKTTIASLATRLWDIESGSILLDGRDLRDYSLNSLRQSIQSVQQDVFLFSGSLKENITLGRDISEEDIIKAAKMVQADSFIEKLEDSYDTELQERGKNLSGGQKQLLSFARALAHNPAVLILDEATANIDTETEKLIQKAMDNLLKDRTSLVIAHRLSTIQKADQILVLSEGHLLESGTHDELLEKEGLYHKLYNYQYAASENL